MGCPSTCCGSAVGRRRRIGVAEVVVAVFVVDPVRTSMLEKGHKARQHRQSGQRHDGYLKVNQRPHRLGDAVLVHWQQTQQHLPLLPTQGTLRHRVYSQHRSFDVVVPIEALCAFGSGPAALGMGFGSTSWPRPWAAAEVELEDDAEAEDNCDDDDPFRPRRR